MALIIGSADHRRRIHGHKQRALICREAIATHRHCDPRRLVCTRVDGRGDTGSGAGAVEPGRPRAGHPGGRLQREELVAELAALMGKHGVLEPSVEGMVLWLDQAQVSVEAKVGG